MRCVFVRFLEEIEDTKKTFRTYLTFRVCEKISFFMTSIIFWYFTGSSQSGVGGSNSVYCGGFLNDFPTATTDAKIRGYSFGLFSNYSNQNPLLSRWAKDKDIKKHTTYNFRLHNSIWGVSGNRCHTRCNCYYWRKWWQR